MITVVFLNNRNAWARDRRTAAPSGIETQTIFFFGKINRLQCLNVVAQKLASVFKPKKDGAAPATLPRNGGLKTWIPLTSNCECLLFVLKTLLAASSSSSSAPIAPPTVSDADMQALVRSEHIICVLLLKMKIQNRKCGNR